jgi:hypothetical protein
VVIVSGRRNENVGSFKVTPLTTGISKDIHVQNLETEFVHNLANHPFHSTVPQNKRKVIPLNAENTFDATHLLKIVAAPKNSPLLTRSSKIVKKQDVESPLEGDFEQIFEGVPQEDHIQGSGPFAPADQDEVEEFSTYQPPSSSPELEPKLEFSPVIPPAETEINEFFQDLIEDWPEASTWDHSFLLLSSSESSL